MTEDTSDKIIPEEKEEEGLNAWESYQLIGLVLVTLAFVGLDLFLLGNIHKKHVTIKKLQSEVMNLRRPASLTEPSTSQSLQGQSGGTVAPGGEQFPPSGAIPSIPSVEHKEEDNGDQEFNWLKACLAEVAKARAEEKPPTGNESPGEAFRKAVWGFYLLIAPLACVYAFWAAINLCFLFSLALLFLAVILFLISKLLEHYENKCKKKKKKKWWQKLLCRLVTILKWVTLTLSIISVIASIVIFIICVLQVLTL